MDVEELLNLFDSHWFQHEILKPKQPFSPISKTSQILESNEQLAKLSRTSTFIVRSRSDQSLSSKDSLISDSTSPKSVLVEPKLQPILSGKEDNEFQFSAGPVKGASVIKSSYRRRKKKSNSKSLSELEFEELKGFMDLGFMFSDKDKDSSLVKMIPGLRRLGKENEEMGFEEEARVSRPHLSEAWDVWEEQKKMERINPLKSWKINPAIGNEMEIKDQLKFWAHTVASTVR